MGHIAVKVRPSPCRRRVRWRQLGKLQHRRTETEPRWPRKSSWWNKCHQNPDKHWESEAATQNTNLKHVRRFSKGSEHINGNRVIWRWVRKPKWSIFIPMLPFTSVPQVYNFSGHVAAEQMISPSPSDLTDGTSAKLDFFYVCAMTWVTNTQRKRQDAQQADGPSTPHPM